MERTLIHLFNEADDTDVCSRHEQSAACKAFVDISVASAC